MTATVEIPRLIRYLEYAKAMNLSVGTVKRQLQSGTCEVPPALTRPYRWRASDVKRHIETASVSHDRAVKAKQKLRLMRERQGAA